MRVFFYWLSVCTASSELQTERNTRTTLQKSFEQSEQDRLKKLSEYETEIAALKQYLDSR